MTVSTKIRRTLLATVLALGFVAAACGSDDDTARTAAAAAEHGHDSAESSAAIELRHDMRKLWEDQVTWTRQLIVSAIAGLPDTDAAAGRLLQNQADIGNAVAAYYGNDAGSQLTALLREHVLVAADLLTAAKAGDLATLEAKKAGWDDNAVAIAEFLAGANPAWPADTLTTMMRTHLDDTLAEATARLTGDWAADIAAYDRVHAHILKMADALTAGIVGQFPDRFED